MRSAWNALVVLAILTGVGCATSSTDSIVDRPDFAERFVEADARGTFVVYDSGQQQWLVHDEARAQRRYIPASTFKIFNSLVALETGAVSDTSAIFEWDGTERSIPNWNRDQTLATAFENSAVWVYQDIARRIGEDRMLAHIQRAGYGNQDIGGGIDLFWLTGQLRISPMEQIDLLRTLHERTAPFSERTMDLVEGIMVEERGANYVLYGKSGLADGDPADVGWYVGYVVRGDTTYYFALQMDVTRPDHIAARRTIARSILADLGIL